MLKAKSSRKTTLWQKASSSSRVNVWWSLLHEVKFISINCFYFQNFTIYFVSLFPSILLMTKREKIYICVCVCLSLTIAEPQRCKIILNQGRALIKGELSKIGGAFTLNIKAWNFRWRWCLTFIYVVCIAKFKFLCHDKLYVIYFTHLSLLFDNVKGGECKIMPLQILVLMKTFFRSKWSWQKNEKSIK